MCISHCMILTVNIIIIYLELHNLMVNVIVMDEELC